MKCYKSGLFVLLIFYLACDIIAIPTNVSNEQKPDSSNQNNCTKKCGVNQICENEMCRCKTGYVDKDSENQICELNECKTSCTDAEECIEGNCINRATCDSKNPDCDKSNENSPKTSSDVNHNNNFTITSSATKVTVTPSLTTHNTTSITIKPSTSSPKPTPKPTTKPQKSGMSPWSITGIIVLVACLAGLGGFIIYRQKNRGSYRATSTGGH